MRGCECHVQECSDHYWGQWRAIAGSRQRRDGVRFGFRKISQPLEEPTEDKAFKPWVEKKGQGCQGHEGKGEWTIRADDSQSHYEKAQEMATGFTSKGANRNCTECSVQDTLCVDT